MLTKAKPAQYARTTFYRPDSRRARPQTRPRPHFLQKASATTPGRTQTSSKARHGLINWHSWDGKLWEPEKLTFFRRSPEFEVVESIQSRLQQMTSEKFSRLREVDKFLVAHDYASLTAIERLRSFRVLVVDFNAIIFLLKTSPRHIYRQFHDDVSSISTTTYAIDQDMRALAIPQRNLAMLPYNPLYVISRVQKERWSATINQHKTAILIAQKEFRYAYKASEGLKWRDRKKNLALSTIKHVGYLPASTYPEPYYSRPYTWAIEPIISCTAIVTSKQRRTIKFLEEILDGGMDHWIGQWRWRKMNRIFQSLLEQEKGVYGLVKDLAGLVYFRAWRYGVSDAEIKLGKAFYAQLSRKFGDTSFPTPPEDGA